MINNSLYNLSDFQEQIFSICYQHPDTCAYNIPAAIEIKGEINYILLHETLRSIQDHHPELKIRITKVNGEYLQFIGDPVLINKKHSHKQDIDFKLIREAQIPIRCDDSPLARVIVWEIDPAHCIVQFTISHIIADRSSLTMLISSLWNIYNDLMASSPIVKNGNPTFLQSLSTNTTSTKNAYLENLNQLTISDYIPLDFSRSEKFDFNGDWVEGNTSGILYKEIKQYSRQNKTRPYVFFAAILSSLLYKLSSYKDITVASAISTRSLKYMQSFGPFVNTMLLRQVLNDGMESYSNLLASTHDTIQQAIDNSGTSFSSLISQLRKERNIGEHIYQCMYVYNSNDFETFSNQHLSMRLFLINNKSAKCDLTLYIFDCGNDFKIKLEYATSIFKKETIKLLLDSLIQLAKNVVRYPGYTLSDQINHNDSSVKIYESGEKVKLISKFLLLDKFEENFKKYASNLAVIHKDRNYTYSDLDRLSNNVAANLINNGIKNADVVGVYTERTHELIPILIGIWKVRGVYLPLECSLPPERLQNILETAAPKLILINKEHATNIVFNDNICLNFTQILEPAPNTTHTYVRPKESDGAYIIFTSGSTGKPKGVINNHLGIFNRILWMNNDLNISSNDKILNKTSLMFDVSMWELLLPFYSGCVLIIAEKGKNSDPEYLCNLIAKYQVSIVHFVPIFLDIAYKVFKKFKFDSIRHIVCSGDVLKSSTIINTYSLLAKEAIINNYYGPTEAAIDVTHYKCPRFGLERITPIGKPIWNTTIFLLNDMQIVNDCLTPGELYISGICLATGYYNSTVLTADRFALIETSSRKVRAYKTGDLAMWSSTGELLFLGRNDRQIKIKGIRIEAEELESKLEMHPLINNAYIRKQIEDNSFENLIAYIVLRQNSSLEDIDLKKYLLQYFTNSVIPNQFVFLDRLPLLQNGKIDVNSLIKLDIIRNNPESIKVESITADEQILISIWKNVLGCEVNVNDNYFNLGGDSIKSIQIVSTAKDYGFSFTVSDFFNNPTVTSLSKFKENKSSIKEVTTYRAFELISTKDKININDDIEDAFPLSVLQQSLIYHSDVSDYYRIYVTTFKIACKFDFILWQQAIQNASLIHPIMRTYFDIGTYGKPMQLILKSTLQYCNYIDIRHIIDKEIIINDFFVKEQTNIFDWDEAPLFRFYIHHLEKNLIQFTISEPCLDGWSVSIICTQIFKNYIALVNNTPLAINLGNNSLGLFIKQESEALQSTNHLKYWDYFLSQSVTTNLVRNSKGKMSVFRKEYRLSKPDTESILACVKQHDIPLKSFLLALHCKLVSHITGQNKITTGLMSNARPETKNAESIAGMFINVLPITISVNTKSTIEMAKELVSIEAEHNKYRSLPYAIIMKNEKNIEFDSLFNFTNFYPYKEFTDRQELSVLSMKGSDQTLFNVTLQFTLLPIENILRLAVDFNNLQDSDPIVNNVMNFITDTLKNGCLEINVICDAF